MLSEPVNVSTMIRPNSTSEMRSAGSSTRREARFAGSAATAMLSGTVRSDWGVVVI